MSEKIVAVVNVDDVKGKEIFPGVIQRILISKDVTASKKFAVSNIHIEPGSKYGPITYNGELFYYVLCGRGNFTYTGLGSDWTEWNWEGNAYLYLPPGRPHYILNQGESPMRVFKAEYDAPRPFAAGGGIELWHRDKCPRIDYTPECISHVIAPMELLKAKGAEHINVVEYEVFAPKTSMPPLGGVPPSVELGPEALGPPSEMIQYVVRGEGRYIVDKKEYPVKAGSAVYIHGYESKLEATGPWTLDMMFVSCLI